MVAKIWESIRGRFTGRQGNWETERFFYETDAYSAFFKRLGLGGSFHDVYYLDFMIDLLRKEVKYSALLEINRGNDSNRYVLPISKMCAELLGYQSDGLRKVDLSKDIVISAPWVESRYKKALRTFKTEKFEYQGNNHGVDYYEYLDIACVYNGKHSIGVASYLGEGIVHANYYDTTKVFPYIETNGYAFYYNRKAIMDRLADESIAMTQKMKDELQRSYRADYRLALLYQLCRQKYFLERGQENKLPVLPKRYVERNTCE